MKRGKMGTVEILSWDWPYHEAPYFHGPAGGINSNIMDMSKWLRLQLGKGKFQMFPTVMGAKKFLTMPIFNCQNR